MQIRVVQTCVENSFLLKLEPIKKIGLIPGEIF
jgi:hypothetical protein